MDGPAISHCRLTQDWEDWEDDHVVSPIDAADPSAVQLPPPVYTRERPSTKPPSAARASRHPSAKVRRLKSRRRQKAQNAKAGIKLVTDMAVFKRGNHIAHQARPAEPVPAKFVDAVALRALEGEPSSASVGNWNWLNKDADTPRRCASPLQPAPTPVQELSPEDRPIVIGISLPPDQASSPEATPRQAPVDALKMQIPPSACQHPPATNAHLQKSVWSPDTPDTMNSFGIYRAASSVYSRAFTPAGDSTPPVPALPATYQKTPQQGVISDATCSSQSEDDGGTPCTLFEEDGNSPARKQPLPKGLCLSPDSATSRSHGWWDHVVTPFLDRKLSFSSRKMRADSPASEAKSPRSFCAVMDKSQGGRPPARNLLLAQAPIVRKPTPRRTVSPAPNTQAAEMSRHASAQPAPGPNSEHAPAIAGGAAGTEDAQGDQPPPYSPRKKQSAARVRYRAVFPPRHPLHAQFPPSPHVASPGLVATMTSQGAGPMTDIPLTPTTHGRTRSSLRIPLPVRPLGSYAPCERDTAAARTKAERQRRRHEKEEVVARRLGGIWRGRGCVPTTGCFGRSGREGRQRRRVWLVLWAGIISLMILIIVLALVLTRRHHEAPRDSHSIWVNLTDFPPMPTGILTVVGPENSMSRSACTAPSTLWSCALPKDQQDAVAPYRANQPTIVMQIQWDNSSKGTNRSGESEKDRRGIGAASRVRGLLRRRQTTLSFTPKPGAPSRDEMWFLGNTTDGIQSESKAGEPTPFYISLLKSIHDPVKASILSPRDAGSRIGNASLAKLLPAPELEVNGTPAPAVMLPDPMHQPVRLFDRGLPTEHYGFYTHFRRSLFLKSVTILNKTEGGNVPLDEDGGCRKDEANSLVTWGETRVLVQIWTRTMGLNTSSLLSPDGSGGIGGTGELVRPGTMPWPVTVTLDTHGGNPVKKLVWSWPLDKRQHVGADKAELLANNMGVGGTWINPRGSGDATVGGFDGGSGGCRCEWVNWVRQVS